MNGVDIPRPYGYPVRCIVPGHAGARNCKYLEMVTVTDCPCKGNSNWKQYAVHAPDVPMRKIADFEMHHTELMMDPAVQEMPGVFLCLQPAPASNPDCRLSTVWSVHCLGELTRCCGDVGMRMH